MVTQRREPGPVLFHALQHQRAHLRLALGRRAWIANTYRQWSSSNAWFVSGSVCSPTFIAGP
jgi:hypothetical protein